MASGIVHDKFTRFLSFPTTLGYVGLVHLFYEPKQTLLLGLSYYLGIQMQRWMTPDTDVDKGFYGFFLVDMFDPIIGKIWKILWWPFAKLVSHRSWLSHAPIVGTLMKAAYILVMISPIILTVFYLDIRPQIEYIYIISIFIGMLIGDLGHLLLDYSMFARKLAERIFSE